MSNVKLNSPKFWNEKIKDNKIILKSPIYNHKLKIVTNLLYKVDGSLLDVGLGYGVLEGQLNKIKPNLKISGIDISSFAILKAKQNYKGDFMVGSILDIPFKDKKFDVVLALDVLEHFEIEKCMKGLKEINRVLKSNGQFILSVPINESKIDYKRNHHMQNYDFSKVERQLHDMGFKIKQVYYLTAFQKYYWIKNVINFIFKISKPNLLIINSIKI